MSLFDTFDPVSEEILKPSHMIRPVDGFPETAVLTFEEKSLQVLQSLCRTETAATLKGGRDIPVYKFRWNGRELGLLQALIGGAATAALVEEVLALGAKKILLYGSCGVLDGALTAGRLILPTYLQGRVGTAYGTMIKIYQGVGFHYEHAFTPETYRMLLERLRLAPVAVEVISGRVPEGIAVLEKPT